MAKYWTYGTGGWEKTTGTPIKIPDAPWLSTLFITRLGRGWTISESRTGRRFSGGQSKEEAVERAELFIAERGRKGIEQQIVKLEAEQPPPPSDEEGLFT